MIFDYHPKWSDARTSFIRKYFPEKFFEGKKILELGSYHSDIGNYLSELGAKVTCWEGRQSNVDEAIKRYPHLEIKIVDAEHLVIDKKFDIIVNMGLLYHLSNIDNLIEQCAKSCSYMILETEVIDNNLEATSETMHEPDGLDQGLKVGKHGVRPSELWVENKLIECNMEFEKINSSELNGGMHFYDWENKNDNGFKPGQRRFWMCRSKGTK